MPSVEIEHGRLRLIQGKDVDVAGGGLHEAGKGLIDRDEVGRIPPRDWAPLRRRNEELSKQTKTER